MNCSYCGKEIYSENCFFDIDLDLVICEDCMVEMILEKNTGLGA